ncbi:MAG: hypothetical protein BMS9Abin04_224 [Planctomycetia bacterium]|nr:MAG: hypothetical protein BMS9Abin04_224 [Planctomycetia bacterium]
MWKVAIGLVVVPALLVLPSFGAEPNLLPNGDAENEFVNHLTADGGRSTSIKAIDSGIPTYWRLTEAARLCKEVKHGGLRAIELQGGDRAASATVFSDYWRVKDVSMPFGLPLVPAREVRVSFYYRTSPALPSGALKATVQLGTIASLPADTDELSLPPAGQWQRVETTIQPAQLRWGGAVTFTLAAGAGDTMRVWIDDVRLAQDLGDPRNLVHNASFEQGSAAAAWPAAWSPPIEDQWVSWVGDRYRPPRWEDSTAVSGRRSLRASVTYADVSGVSQEIRLDQQVPRPVVVGIWSKLDNSIGNGPQGYHGSDNLPNLTVFVTHRDGTMQEVSPTFCLGESDHDWDYRRGGFLPQKSVAKIRLQVSVIGTEPTTSLWIDDVAVYELGADASAGLASAAGAPCRTLSCAWGRPNGRAAASLAAGNDGANLYFSIPRRPESRVALIYLNTHAKAGFVDHYRYLYDVVKISADGAFEKGTVAEKQGLIACGQYVDATALGLTLERTAEAYLVTIPLPAIRLEGPPGDAIGFNVQWLTAAGSAYWTGNAINVDQLGTLIPAPEPSVTIRSLRFGRRYQQETDQSQDLVSHPPIYAGMNEAELCLANGGEAVRVDITAGVRGRQPFVGSCDIAANAERTITFAYDAGVGRLGEFDISLGTGGRQLVRTSYPLAIPPAVEIVLDQEFYFPEEKRGKAEIHNRFRPIPQQGRAVLQVEDLVTGEIVFRSDQKSSPAVSVLSFPIDRLRINDQPVQDYRVVVSLFDQADMPLGSHSARFGRIHHTKRRPLPAIKKVRVDDLGRIVINDDFRFFPIVPSLTSAEWHDAIDLGANVCRTYYNVGKKAQGAETGLLDHVEQAWAAGAYTLTIGPGPSQMDEFEKQAETLLAHPGFLGCYAKQFYYWRLTDDLVQYRKKVERIVGAQPAARLVVWGHHDSSFLYDHDRPPWPIERPPVGYCYVKIMGRPGSAWRNAPFLTQVEQVLNPHRFKLAEVNHYVSWHDDEIVPEHFSTYYSIRGDQWRGVRNESYLAVIYGANGLYHYICTQQDGVQRLRGWFQELNFMWPIFVADDAEAELTVSPADSMIEARLKKWNGKYYLLTANASETVRHAQVSIHGFDRLTVRKLFDTTGDMALENNTIIDKWRKYDVFVYEISRPGS